MKSEKFNKIVSNVCFVVGCALAVALIARYRFGQTGPGGSLYLPDYSDITGHAGPLSIMQRWAMALADGLMVVGVVATSIGAMTWISTTGLFDALGYGTSVIWNRLTFRSSKQLRFYDYKIAKKEARKRTKPVRFILAVGVLMLALSVVCTMAFYRG